MTSDEVGGSMTSAVAFVEGGAQDACDDACSICLESFCDDDPAAVTTCKHEYHLQCILEWSQRSKECPMCWQPLSLKDPDSQELLTAVEHERASRRNKIQASSVYQRSPIEDYEFHRFASYGDEDCIMQHLAAAAIGRAHQLARRDPIRFRSSSTAQGHPLFVLVPSTQASAASTPATSMPVAPSLVAHSTNEAPAATLTSHSVGASDSNALDSYSLRQRAVLEPEENQHRTSSSELHSFSELFKSRLVAASSRYKESLTKSTRGFRERLRMRNGTMADLGAQAREVSAGVVRVLERMSLESADKQHDSPSASDLPLVGYPPLPDPSRSGSGGSTSSIDPTVYAGSVTASSSRVAPQPASEKACEDVLAKGSAVTKGPQLNNLKKGHEGRDEA